MGGNRTFVLLLFFRLCGRTQNISRKFNAKPDFTFCINRGLLPAGRLAFFTLRRDTGRQIGRNRLPRMLVFWNQGLVLLAMPKTATTALLGGLRKYATAIVTQPPEIKHVPYYRYRRFLHPFYQRAGGKEMETVAVVREPSDWLGSWYRYRHREAIAGERNSTRDISFDDFVAQYLEEKPKPFARVGSQSKFLRDNDGVIGVTYLFPYEDLDDLVEFFSDRIGEVITLPVKNVSPKMNLSLDPALKKRLMAERAEEYEVWDAARQQTLARREATG
ncbi:gamma-glutamyl kinase [Aestuariibius sp. 2305UL40-4]|uniref:gamma-glutamyl kinase n=1 Tax=Aestuariibius violaceus TaxID=3234132 RepID=UPI00345E2F25